MVFRGARSISYAQNFLTNRRLVRELVTRSSIGPDDIVVEIGPGTGLITDYLAAASRGVIAIEKDPALVARLHDRLATLPNLVLFEGDFLSFPLPASPYKVFANIPFNVTAAIVGKLVSGSSPPRDAYLVVQAEAAEKFLGRPKQTLAAVLLMAEFEPTIVHRFRPTDFTPRPGVATVLLRFQLRSVPLISLDVLPLFRDFTTALFTAWQPTMRDALRRTVSRGLSSTLECELGQALSQKPSQTPFDTWLRIFVRCTELAGSDLGPAVTGAAERLRQQQADLHKDHRTRKTRRS